VPKTYPFETVILIAPPVILLGHTETKAKRETILDKLLACKNTEEMAGPDGL
jgi:hypothetical protein